MLDNSNNPRIIIALDYADSAAAFKLVRQLDPSRCNLKIGKEMFTRYGPALVKDLIADQFRVFLDLKFHDIPNTVAKACRAAAELGVWMLTLHTLGGEAMLAAAVKELQGLAARPLLVGVTLLTSMTESELSALGMSGSIAENVTRLAMLAQSAGLDGVVCSAQEAVSLRQTLGQDICLVTPGIRLPGAQADDQARVCTPRAAVQAGADYLVIGRPITQAKDPLAMLQAIEADMGVEMQQTNPSPLVGPIRQE